MERLQMAHPRPCLPVHFGGGTDSVPGHRPETQQGDGKETEKHYRENVDGSGTGAPTDFHGTPRRTRTSTDDTEVAYRGLKNGCLTLKTKRGETSNPPWAILTISARAFIKYHAISAPRSCRILALPRRSGGWSMIFPSPCMPNSRGS